MQLPALGSERAGHVVPLMMQEHADDKKEHRGNGAKHDRNERRGVGESERPIERTQECAAVAGSEGCLVLLIEGRGIDRTPGNVMRGYSLFLSCRGEHIYHRIQLRLAHTRCARVGEERGFDRGAQFRVAARGLCMREKWHAERCEEDRAKCKEKCGAGSCHTKSIARPVVSVLDIGG